MKLRKVLIKTAQHLDGSNISLLVYEEKWVEERDALVLALQCSACIVTDETKVIGCLEIKKS